MTMFRKLMAAGAIAIALASVPSHLAAQEKAAPTVAQASVLGWLSSLWSDLTAWLTSETSEVVPLQPQPPPASFVDGRCAIDPDGCPGV